jgi:hypothetical protein
MTANTDGLGRQQLAMLRRLHTSTVYNCYLRYGDRERMHILARRGLALKSDARWILSSDGQAYMEAQS